MVNSEGVIIRELFKTPPTFGLRVSVLAVAALFCIFLDHSSARFHAYRQQAEIVVHPMRLFVDKPIEWVHQATQGLTLQRDLIRENDQLRIKEIILQSQVQQLLELQRENKQLKALLSSSSGVTGRVKVANILAISMDPNLHQLILNKGHHDQVYSGQPVFDAFGVMGQVVDATRDTSKVLLITDPRTAIPVKDYRTGMRAIVEGSGDGHSLRLLNVSTLADVKTGDVFVTSGLWPPLSARLSCGCGHPSSASCRTTIFTRGLATLCPFRSNTARVTGMAESIKITQSSKTIIRKKLTPD